MLLLNPSFLKKNLRIYDISINFYKILNKGPFGCFEKYFSKKFNLVFNELGFFFTVKEKLTKKVNSLVSSEFSGLKNLILDVNYGYSILMEVRGLGFKVNLSKNNIVLLNLGYSHTICYKLPEDVFVKFLDSKKTVFILFGKNRQQVLTLALKLKLLKALDKYKGKGLFFLDENIKLKEGKSKVT